MCLVIDLYANKFNLANISVTLILAVKQKQTKKDSQVKINSKEIFSPPLLPPLTIFAAVHSVYEMFGLT